MDLGKKILDLRKKENLSQEQLAEKMNVTRQTISKWELNQTTPDIKQAKELSRLFKISLDELTDNDMTTLVMQKINNTEKLASLVLKVSKWIGVCFLVILVIDIISFIIFMFIK
jgi:transcriptional regulator with XRE-family HTH domain